MTVFVLEARALHMLGTAEQQVTPLGAAPRAAVAENPPGTLGCQQPLLPNGQLLPDALLGDRGGNVTKQQCLGKEAACLSVYKPDFLPFPPFNKARLYYITRQRAACSTQGQLA